METNDVNQFNDGDDGESECSDPNGIDAWSVAEIEPQSWKDTLREAFEKALSEMDEEAGAEAAAAMLEPPVEDGDDEDNEPDLYSFYEALAALRGEQRAGNRKTADAFARFTDVLSTLDGQLADLKESARADRESEPSDEVSDRFCMGLAGKGRGIL